MLHNGLVSQLYEIQNEQGENTYTYLTELINRRRIPSYVVPGVGIAELTQIEEKFFIRILHAPTETIFYILDERRLSADSQHLKKVEARQHFVAGSARQDHQKGRDVILLWRDGEKNIRTVISPRIQKTPEENQKILPRFQDPESFREISREHRRLHRRDYWNALWKWPGWDGVSFGIAKALFQGVLVAGGVGLIQEHISGEDFNIVPAMCITGAFSLVMCSFASTYRYWINMGERGFFQRKEHVGWGDVTKSINDIDWNATLRSKAARTSVTSLLFAWPFLYFTDPRVDNIDGIMSFFEFFLVAQLIAIPNLILNNAARVAWSEQATLNELAGRTNGRQTFHIPFLPPFSWSLRNMDHLWLRYFFYDLGRMFHLTGVQLPPALVSAAASYGLDLGALGINAGLIAMVFMLWLGKFLTLRMVFKLHYQKLISDRQAWFYLDDMTKESTGGLFLSIDSMYRRLLSWWHRMHVPSETRENLRQILFSDQPLVESLSSRTAHHFEQWRRHEQIHLAQQQERALHNDRQRISRIMTELERSFIQHFIDNVGEELLSANLREQTRVSFMNFGKVLHALSETLKAYAAYHTASSTSTSQAPSFYAQIWERSRHGNNELEDILNFFKEKLTEKFPHLRQALDVITREIQAEALQDVARLQDVNVLETLLQEFSEFIQTHLDTFQGYMDEQDFKSMTHRSGGVLQNTGNSGQFKLDLNFPPKVEIVNDMCINSVSNRNQNSR